MISIRFKKMHFVGIGGIGMSGLAEVFFNLGFEISGSDIVINDSIERLRRLNIPISIGHNAENVVGKDVVIYSSSIREDNPEIIRAHSLRIPVIRRAELLAELVRMKYSILISGAHGKTTTTSLISTLFIDAGFDPTVIIGGRLNRFGTNAILGKGEYLVAESDESDGSFLSLLPTIAIITNIDREHLDFYVDFDSIKEAFIEFANKVPFYGFVVVCGEDLGTQEILPRIKRRVITYGFSEDCEYCAKHINLSASGISFDAYKGRDPIGRFNTQLVGRHNVLNSLASVVIGNELQIPYEKIRDSLANFRGIHRRFEIKGEKNGVLVIDDYGHHPTEIKATLETLRLIGRQRTFIVFQPHRYSRTKVLFDDFVELFRDVKELILMDIYSANEQPICGIDSACLLKEIRKRGNDSAVLIRESEDVLKYIKGHALPGDAIVTIGAGSVYKIGEEFLKE